MVSKKEVADLEKLVNNAEKKYNGIIDFVEKVTSELGELTNYGLHDFYTNIKREFPIDNFIFVSDQGHSSMGGNNTEIMYNGKKVLDLYYQVPNDTPTVRAYEPGEWESKLGVLITSQEQVIKNYQTMYETVVQERKDRAKKLIKASHSYYEVEEQASASNYRKPTKKEIEAQKLEDKRKKLEEKAKKLGIK